MDIADALKAKGYEIDRRKINLKDTIKETGEFTANVKLHREVTLEIPVTVTAEGGASNVDARKSAKSENAETETADSEEKVVENSVENNDDEVET